MPRPRAAARQARPRGCLAPQTYGEARDRLSQLPVEPLGWYPPGPMTKRRPAARMPWGQRTKVMLATGGCLPPQGRATCPGAGCCLPLPCCCTSRRAASLLVPGAPSQPANRAHAASLPQPPAASTAPGGCHVAASPTATAAASTSCAVRCPTAPAALRSDCCRRQRFLPLLPRLSGSGPPRSLLHSLPPDHNAHLPSREAHPSPLLRDPPGPVGRTPRPGRRWGSPGGG